MVISKHQPHLIRSKFTATHFGTTNATTRHARKNINFNNVATTPTHNIESKSSWRELADL